MSCLERQKALEIQFAKIPDPKGRYDLIIELGRELKKAARNEIAVPENMVQGCQSEVYLKSRFEDGKIFFEIYSEALISTGLAALLFSIYQGESPDILLTCPPDCLERIGIQASLSPGRSNGLASIHLKMKQEALRYLVKK